MNFKIEGMRVKWVDELLRMDVNTILVYILIGGLRRQYDL